MLEEDDAARVVLGGYRDGPDKLMKFLRQILNSIVCFKMG